MKVIVDIGVVPETDFESTQGINDAIRDGTLKDLVKAVMDHMGAGKSVLNPISFACGKVLKKYSECKNERIEDIIEKSAMKEKILNNDDSAWIKVNFDVVNKPLKELLMRFEKK